MIIPNDDGYMENITGHNRYDMPEGVVRVTGGQGGESFLIIGSEKTALYDMGMACYKDELISNIHEVLDPLGRTLDYALLSHTHYDHIGALPYVIDEFPDIVVFGAPKATQVFESETAKQTMIRLGQNACELFGKLNIDVKAEPLRVDVELEDGMEISLGKEIIIAYDAKGHTDCSVCYMVLPGKIFFSNESIGIQETNSYLSCSPIKSHKDCIETTERFERFDIESLIVMHYGSVPKWYIPEYFEKVKKQLRWEYSFISDCLKQGMTDQEISDEFDKYCWKPERNLSQPYAAYHLNTMIIIARMRKELCL